MNRSDEDCVRIRALLARTRPLNGCEVPDAYWEGRGLIEELALAHETETDCSWSPEQCATVAEFFSVIEPTAGNCFCHDPSELSSTCGLHAVLEFLADQVRGFVRVPVAA